MQDNRVCRERNASLRLRTYNLYPLSAQVSRTMLLFVPHISPPITYTWLEDNDHDGED